MNLKKNDDASERPLDSVVMPDYRELAKSLNSHVMPLIEQVLTKHGAAVLKELHEEVKSYKEMERKMQRYETALKRIQAECTARKAVLIATHALDEA